MQRKCHRRNPWWSRRTTLPVSALPVSLPAPCSNDSLPQAISLFLTVSCFGFLVCQVQYIEGKNLKQPLTTIPTPPFDGEPFRRLKRHFIFNLKSKVTAVLICKEICGSLRLSTCQHPFKQNLAIEFLRVACEGRTQISLPGIRGGAFLARESISKFGG